MHRKYCSVALDARKDINDTSQLVISTGIVDEDCVVQKLVKMQPLQLWSQLSINM